MNIENYSWSEFTFSRLRKCVLETHLPLVALKPPQHPEAPWVPSQDLRTQEFLAVSLPWAFEVHCSQAAVAARGTSQGDKVTPLTFTWQTSAASFSYKSEQSVMKINAEGKTEAFYPDIYFRLRPLKTTTAHTPFPWLGFNDAINEDPGLLQCNQAVSERMKRETHLNTLGTLSLLIYFLLQVKMYREALWSSDSRVRRIVSIIGEQDWIN